MGRRDCKLRPGQRIVLLIAALITLAGCDSPLGGRHYLPANAGVDPYQTLRAQTEQYYEAGIAAENKGNLAQALEDYRQARQWDHDGRQDIQIALNRVEATTGRQQRAQPTPTSSAPGIALRPFRSLVFPYAISVPADWTTKQEVTNDQPIDTFLSPPSKSINAVMLITVDSVGSGTTLDELYVGTKRSLEADGVDGVQIVDRRQIGDQPTYVMSYRTSVGSSQASVLHAIFVTPSHAWHIILIATPSTTAALVKTFDVVLDSVTFQASAFPVQ
jgi:hypothetical protein